LKLYGRRPIDTVLSDKYAVKEYIANKIGSQYVIPLIGVWDRFDDIDFNSLPNQFVLKCTHDSGGIVICKDKKTLDIVAAKAKIDRGMSHNFYVYSREKAYRDIPRRIIAEEYREDSKTGELRDYKFFCFNGEPKVMYISSGLEDHATASISFADMNYKLLDIERADYKALDKLPPKPESFEEMKRIAKKLSKGFPEVRVDLYEINGKPYFGELTFYTCGGMVPWKKHEYDERLGRMIKLPRKEYDK
jgi:hypothetical protein